MSQNDEWFQLVVSVPPLQVSGICGNAPQRASRSVGPPPHQLPAAPVGRHPQPASSDADETLAGLRR